MATVVTYQHAYIGGESTLCTACAQDSEILNRLPALGPVQYGQHRGECDGCESDADARKAARVKG